MEMKKLMAIGVIFLFIGVAVAPSINSSVVKTSDDLVEVTSQACGIQGFGNTTVKLTKQQYQNLEQYLVEFRAKLNQTTTREEAVPIFKEAVVELNKYGLLPKGMSISQAQKLVISRFQNDGLFKIILQHQFGFIIGETTYTHFVGIPLIPMKLYCAITLGDKELYYWYPWPSYSWSLGNITTIGIDGQGQRNYSGYMSGGFGSIFMPGLTTGYWFQIGIKGFTGLQVGMFGGRGHHFYFGTASRVNIILH